MNSKLPVLAATALVWATAAAIAVFWLLQLMGSPALGKQDSRTPRNDQLATLDTLVNTPDPAALAQLLGQEVSNNPSVGAYRLIGVVAQGKGGAALLALNDQPAKAYRPGSQLDEMTVLQAVGPRHVLLGNGRSDSAVQRLDLPTE